MKNITFEIMPSNETLQEMAKRQKQLKTTQKLKLHECSTDCLTCKYYYTCDRETRLTDNERDYWLGQRETADEIEKEGGAHYDL